ncbi:MAG TPA: alpha-ribazole phosphatase [Cyclobacteriaceae bacterium]|jgi:alpha-ribazole phosphatase
MEIYMIRHTTPDIKKGICYGQSEIPLSATFPQEATPVLRNLPKDIAIIYTSPLSRCLRLAELLSKEISAHVKTDNRLLEINFGEWEKKPWNKIEHNLLQRWMNDYVNERCPGGESYADLASRVTIFLTELKSVTKTRVAVISHHGVMKAAYAFFYGVDLTEAMKRQFNFGEISKFQLSN